MNDRLFKMLNYKFLVQSLKN